MGNCDHVQAHNWIEGLHPSPIQRTTAHAHTVCTSHMAREDVSLAIPQHAMWLHQQEHASLVVHTMTIYIWRITREPRSIVGIRLWTQWTAPLHPVDSLFIIGGYFNVPVTAVTAQPCGFTPVSRLHLRLLYAPVCVFCALCHVMHCILRSTISDQYLMIE